MKHGYFKTYYLIREMLEISLSALETRASLFSMSEGGKSDPRLSDVQMSEIKEDSY